MEKHVPVLASKYGISAAPMTPQMFGAAGKEHMEKYGERKLHTHAVSVDHLIKDALK